jgi:hypothetical protein
LAGNIQGRLKCPGEKAFLILYKLNGMIFLFYEFHWTEWTINTITDHGKGFYFSNQPPGNNCDIHKTIRLFINKPAAVEITIDEIIEISKHEYETKTGKPFHL